MAFFTAIALMRDYASEIIITYTHLKIHLDSKLGRQYLL